MYRSISGVHRGRYFTNVSEEINVWFNLGSKVHSHRANAKANFFLDPCHFSMSTAFA